MIWFLYLSFIGMPQIMQTGATPRSSRSPTPLQTDQTTGVITEQKLLIVSNNSVGNSSVSAASSEVIDKDHLLSPMTQVCQHPYEPLQNDTNSNTSF